MKQKFFAFTLKDIRLLETATETGKLFTKGEKKKSYKELNEWFKEAISELEEKERGV